MNTMKRKWQKKELKRTLHMTLHLSLKTRPCLRSCGHPCTGQPLSTLSRRRINIRRLRLVLHEYLVGFLNAAPHSVRVKMFSSWSVRRVSNAVTTWVVPRKKFCRQQKAAASYQFRKTEFLLGPVLVSPSDHKSPLTTFQRLRQHIAF